MSINCSYTKGEVMTETKEVDRELTSEDRCDSCSAAAMVVATFLNGELLFCGHHAKKIKDNLYLKAVNVFDPNNVLNLLS
jgi:hypothetical protein